MAGQKYESDLEKYWSDEEGSLRKRGIDPMDVPQMEPPKFPTVPGNTTLHKKGGLVRSKSKPRSKGKLVKNTRDYGK